MPTYTTLSHYDPELADAMRHELARQRQGLEMIASENYTSPAVMEATGSFLTNKYSEGYPGRRYYGGNAWIDVVENLARDRAKQLFGAEHANVQSHSGSSCNMEAYFALLNLGDTIMAMDLASGGHLTHGSPVNFSGKFYKFMPYGVNRETERLDMDEIRALALTLRPKLILAGFTAYPRTIDFTAFRAIADEVGALFMVDMAHISGLVAGGAHPSPIPHAHVVTSTTHKTLRGPRGAFILSKSEFAEKIDKAVMPGMQGGPLDHVIAAKAICFKEAMGDEFKRYAAHIVKNCQALGAALASYGVRLVSGGTDNHLLLLDLTNLNVSGKEGEHALDSVGIYTNKNMIPYDPRKPMDPSGMRIGTAALTTRGFNETEIQTVAELIVTTLKHVGNEEKLNDVRRRVRELSDAHPLYPGMSV
ncbi:serine hydroxymethyltransferase [Candidatus Uhrbacteria bacterium RIFCSPHIGHO2_12_FULL_54_23]|uniref:Serine hydroxymethyltransferase n=3 Tax=Candidatus Uhriibacteriota TaxID=1752732 RepID=A0A1F7UFQ3_9BACT|nr:MAG: serine hydroxymethyltransferase [Candidatus Uhrbacteria bacterium RIFCSPHIGHO2_12_FULL_54_23]OGL85506.1 MAG: serine hydroxymethyltransferase [Candidatus Uhrbacteria bacterium RIFCSPLOWO2_01_FULL_55_36]OGL89637.1 MAG: serine hydroxymethyltransferase [Candidatus Uhrbacteria bacterium RIFCSPLOWO2_02_FULL_54_37]